MEPSVLDIGIEVKLPVRVAVADCKANKVNHGVHTARIAVLDCPRRVGDVVSPVALPGNVERSPGQLLVVFEELDQSLVSVRGCDGVVCRGGGVGEADASGLLREYDVGDLDREGGLV